MLEENEQNVGWLLAEFDPENDERDKRLLEGITGFKLSAAMNHSNELKLIEPA